MDGIKDAIVNQLSGEKDGLVPILLEANANTRIVFTCKGNGKTAEAVITPQEMENAMNMDKAQKKEPLALLIDHMNSMWAKLGVVFKIIEEPRVIRLGGVNDLGEISNLSDAERIELLEMIDEEKTLSQFLSRAEKYLTLRFFNVNQTDSININYTYNDLKDYVERK